MENFRCRQTDLSQPTSFQTKRTQTKHTIHIDSREETNTQRAHKGERDRETRGEAESLE